MFRYRHAKRATMMRTHRNMIRCPLSKARDGVDVANSNDCSDIDPALSRPPPAKAVNRATVTRILPLEGARYQIPSGGDRLACSGLALNATPGQSPANRRMHRRHRCNPLFTACRRPALAPERLTQRHFRPTVPPLTRSRTQNQRVRCIGSSSRTRGSGSRVRNGLRPHSRPGHHRANRISPPRQSGLHRR
jgi:hypothetical protein